MKAVAKKAQGSRRLVAAKATGGPSVEDVVAAFKGVNPTSLGDDTNPFSLWQLGRLLGDRLISKGGRPSLFGADCRMKVSLLNEDLPKINQISKSIQAERYQPSPSQVVALLVHMALTSFTEDEVKKTVAAGF